MNNRQIPSTHEVYAAPSLAIPSASLREVGVAITRPRQAPLYCQNRRLVISFFTRFRWCFFHASPDPWADPKSRSTLRFYNLHHRRTGVQNWGIYFLDPPRGLGRGLELAEVVFEMSIHPWDSSCGAHAFGKVKRSLSACARRSNPNWNAKRTDFTKRQVPTV